MPQVAAPRTGRPREFDEESVLDAATIQFHKRGYHATTLSDLLEATGLHKSSLYGAFGDKHQLFVTVLERYVDRRLALAAADLQSAASPLEGIRTYMRRQAREAVAGRGCLSANSAMEMLPGDDEVARAVSRHQRLTKQLFTDAIEAAKYAGEVPAERPAETVGRYLYAVMEGLWELGRTGGEPDALYDVVDAAVRAAG
jgi:TetR/AcrR family transcriptional regulator, transcriptional repressor for nem operon